jgi:DNA-binding LacI/PurR family transcriptional regulator
MDLGHRKVAFITPYHQSQWCVERLRGVQHAFAAAGLPEGVALFDASVDNLLELMVRQKPFSTFRRHLRQFEDAVSRPYDLTQNLFEENLALHHMEAQFLKSHLEPYFRRALADSATTAWIGATDMVGLIALTFLRTNGVGVPQAKSVISYDDTIEAFGVGLSSYSFNVAAIVQAMFDHITSGPSRRARGPQVLEVPGVVMARATTGPVPGGPDS